MPPALGINEEPGCGLMPDETRKTYESIGRLSEAMARVEEQLKVMPNITQNVVSTSLSDHVREYHKKNSLSPRNNGLDKQLIMSIGALVSALAALLIWLLKS